MQAPTCALQRRQRPLAAAGGAGTGRHLQDGQKPGIYVQKGFSCGSTTGKETRPGLGPAPSSQSPTCRAWPRRHERCGLGPRLCRLQRQLPQPVGRQVSPHKAAARLARGGGVKPFTGAADALCDQLLALLLCGVWGSQGSSRCGVGRGCRSAQAASRPNAPLHCCASSTPRVSPGSDCNLSLVPLSHLCQLVKQLVKVSIVRAMHAGVGGWGGGGVIGSDKRAQAAQGMRAEDGISDSQRYAALMQQHERSMFRKAQAACRLPGPPTVCSPGCTPCSPDEVVCTFVKHGPQHVLVRDELRLPPSGAQPQADLARAAAAPTHINALPGRRAAGVPSRGAGASWPQASKRASPARKPGGLVQPQRSPAGPGCVDKTP